MKKSEKILLGVLGVVSLFAGYTLVFEDKPDAANVPGAAAQDESTYAATVEAVKQRLAAKELSEAEAYRVAMATRMTGSAPFYAATTQFYFAAGGDEIIAGETGGLEYSGYLQVNGRTFAIINGMEYEAGEELAVEGYKLMSVTKEYVIVERHDPASGKVFKKQIPLAGSDMEQISLRNAP